jgi:lysophospholipase L1-like esterase
MLKNLKFLFLKVVISLFIIELALQFYNPFPSVVRGDKIVLRSNSKSVYKNTLNDKLDEEIIVSTNSLGLRGPELDIHNEKAPRLITVGGSTTHCLYNSDDKTWVYQLYKSLKEKGKDYWVNNAGLSGQSSIGHKILVEDHLAALKPDYTLFFIGLNDVLCDYKGITDAQFNLFDAASTTGKMKTFLYKSELFGLVTNTLKKRFTREQNFDYNLEYDFAKMQSSSLTQDQRATAYQTFIDKHILEYNNRIESLLATCKVNEVKPILVTHPSPFGNYIDNATQLNMNNVLSNSFPKFDGYVFAKVLSRYNTETIEIAKKHNIQYIDMDSIMVKGSEYYFDELHFSDLGNQVFAKMLAKELGGIIEQ